MKRFYFDLDQCGDVTVDEEGRDEPDLARARDHAIECARDMMVGELREGRLCLGCVIVVRDAAGAAVMSVPFDDAVIVTHASDC